MEQAKSRHPWAWIPTLYFAEGVPYIIVMSVSLVLYKRLGLSNEEIAFYTSWLYLPWVIKPFWSPVVDMFRSKRWWIVTMQLLLGASLAGVAFTLRGPAPVQWSLAFFWLMAFSSATHDIAADGFYMLELDDHEQTFFVGIRSCFYRFAMIAGQGLLVMLAGDLEVYLRNPVKAWSWTFWGAATLFFALFVYHRFFLPYPSEDRETRPRDGEDSLRVFLHTFKTFFQHPQVGIMLAFILLYRFPEALLAKVAPLFLLDKVSVGGLGLTTAEYGLAYGTIGVIGLLLGGVAGGMLIAKIGFRKSLWPMVMGISLPNALYIFLAYFQMKSLFVVNACIFIEQFGYGFGFTAYMSYLIYVSKGPYKTAHYSFCTGLMALGMMLPGMFAGWLQEQMGYLNFFILVLSLCALTFIVAGMIKVDVGFGKKK